MAANGTRTWQEICSYKRAQRDKEIPEAWKISDINYSKGKSLLEIHSYGILSADEVRITTQYDAVGIVEAIREKVFTATAVTIAFCKRAAIAQQLVSICLHNILAQKLTNSRQTACQKSSSKRQLRQQNPWIEDDWKTQIDHLVPFLVCLFHSKTRSVSWVRIPRLV